MPKKARIRSQSGVYYVILRSEKLIFSDDTDAELFLSKVRSVKETDFLEVYAYCLFNESVHLVIKEGLSGISDNIMKIKSDYVKSFNAKHNVSGPLFTGRFISYPIESGEEILETVRKVHRLPLDKQLSLDYVFSSYPAFFKKNTLISSDEIIMLKGSIIDLKIYTESD